MDDRERVVARPTWGCKNEGYRFRLINFCETVGVTFPLSHGAPEPRSL